MTWRSVAGAVLPQRASTARRMALQSRPGRVGNPSLAEAIMPQRLSLTRRMALQSRPARAGNPSHTEVHHATAGESLP